MGKPKGESRGLAFLQRARPEAVHHLLKFFGESARHLDRKTRFLISIVTKVIGNSPRGVEQYVRRALEAGATPNEVVDAVLCAYPCAGLTRVVDAIDVILDMDLDGFSELANAAAGVTSTPEAGHVDVSDAAMDGARDGWVAVADASEIGDGERLRILAGDHDVAIFHIAGRLYACGNRCPHAGGPLSAGALQGTVVTCPLHLWRFDLMSGACLDQPQCLVRTYDVKREGGKVLVRFFVS